MHRAVRIARMAKLMSPQIIIAIGGPHATFAGKECLEQYSEIDCAFIGAGEHAAERIAANLASAVVPYYTDSCDTVYRESGEIKEAPYRGYDKSFITRPARHLLPSLMDYARKLHDRPTISVDTSRGCPGTCKFCTFSLDRKCRWSCRNVKDVEYDIKQTIEDENLETVDVFFTDADFLTSTKRAERLIEMVFRIPQVTRYVIAARSDSIIKAEPILEKLFRSGCATIELGIESAAQTQLDRYNKRTAVTTNQSALDILRKYQKHYRFAISADLIPFDPFVTSEELAETDKLLQKYFRGDVQNEWAFIHEMMLAPGSLFRDETIAAGLACEGNASDVVSWRFLHEDSAQIFACLLYYRNTIYKYKTEIRRKLNRCFELPNIDRRDRMQMYMYYRWLNVITYDIIHETVSAKGTINIIKTVDACRDKLKEIDEFIQEHMRAMA